MAPAASLRKRWVTTPGIVAAMSDDHASARTESTSSVVSTVPDCWSLIC